MMKLLSFRYYVLPYLILFALALIVFLLNEHGHTVLWLNARRTDIMDFFFTYWTHVGDGIIFGVIFLFLVVWKWRVGVVFAVTGLAELVVSSTLKRIIFPEVPRPSKYFEDQGILSFLENVTVHSHYSFPSGHTMTAFTVSTFLAILLRADQKKWSLVLLLGAVLVAISRIYLVQHFLIDVTVGSLLGILIAIFVISVTRKFMAVQWIPEI